MDPTKSVTRRASRWWARRRKKERDTRDEADLPMMVVMSYMRFVGSDFETEEEEVVVVVEEEEEEEEEDCSNNGDERKGEEGMGLMMYNMLCWPMAALLLLCVVGTDTNALVVGANNNNINDGMMMCKIEIIMQLSN